jgi:hypothetical protein
MAAAVTCPRRLAAEGAFECETRRWPAGRFLACTLPSGAYALSYGVVTCAEAGLQVKWVTMPAARILA